MKKTIDGRRLILLVVLAVFTCVVGAGQAFAQEKHTRLTDAAIKSAVEHKLDHAGLQRRGDITVAVDDAVVTLRGKTRSLAEKRRAEKAARAVDDVTRVENELVVETGVRADQEIARDVTREIRSFAFFDIFDWVEGEVKNGVVTLRGAARPSQRLCEIRKEIGGRNARSS
jgi:osmotically-inducible protein OsmY